MLDTKHTIGEYKINSEDTSKMYVEAKNGTETTSFFLNSRQISKVPPDSDQDYENIWLKEPVISDNGKLYVNAEGFMEGFNSIISYNQAENRITIQTLPYLVEYYSQNIKNYDYDNLSEDFNNQKALIYGMLVASKETTGKYGVINIRTNKEIISPRYNEIQFLESSGEFIITNSSSKVGIAYSTGETKINVLYDEIKVLDNKLGYYLVKTNSKYGVIDSKEQTVIYTEYDMIGVDTSEYQFDKINNQYILCNKLIPVCLNEKWGFFDLEGNKITDVEYDTVGSLNTDITEKIANNAMVIEDEGVVIVSKDGQYGGINEKGDLLIPLKFEYIYSVTSGGETTYYMVLNEVTYKAQDMINAMKERLGYNRQENPSQTPDDAQSNNGNTQVQTPTPENTPNNQSSGQDVSDVVI